MSGKIDLIDEDESPRALRETGYDVLLSEGNNLRRFTRVFDWYLKEIRGAEASTT